MTLFVTYPCRYFLQAVLSIDDDLIISCDDLAEALLVWKSNKRYI